MLIVRCDKRHWFYPCKLSMRWYMGTVFVKLDVFLSVSAISFILCAPLSVIDRKRGSARAKTPNLQAGSP